jgi:hypothetical protein
MTIKEYQKIVRICKMFMLIERVEIHFLLKENYSCSLLLQPYKEVFTKLEQIIFDHINKINIS